MSNNSENASKETIGDADAVIRPSCLGDKFIQSGPFSCNEDEDIILEGSPLHEYVKNLCLHDEETNSALGWLPNNKESMHEFWHKTTLKELMLFQWKAFRQKLNFFFPLTHDVMAKLSHYHFIRYGKTLLESRIILDEDLDFLCLRVPKQFLVAAKGQGQAANKSMHENYQKGLALAVIFALFSCLFSQSLPLWICVVITMLLLFVVAFAARIKIIKILCNHKHKQNLLLLQRFLRLSEEFSKSIRRSTRLIQEIEVVSRGYTMINGKTPITRLEKQQTNESRALPRLRMMLLRCILSCIVAYRQSTLSLLHFKLDDDDKISYYICNVSLAELGISLSQDSSSDELLQSTNDCSLSYLKSLNELLVKQRSELLSRVFLVLAYTTLDANIEDFPKNFFDQLIAPNEVTSESQQMLQECYEAHVNVETAKKESSFTSLSSRAENATTQPCSAFQINLHTLQVHLRAALYRSMELESTISKTNATSLHATALSEVKNHLDVGKDCCLRCLEEMECESVSKSSVEYEKSQTTLHHYAEADADDVSEVSSVDYVEDRIYEAVNLDDPENKQTVGGCDVTEKMNREESSIVIRELQSVLAHVTSEKQREMWKQQLFPTYRPKVSETESSDSNPTSQDDQDVDAESASEILPHEIPDAHTNHDDLDSNVKCDVGSKRSVTSHSIGSEDNNSLSDSCKQTDREEATGNPKLTFYKKIAPPGRLPSRTLKRKIGDSLMAENNKGLADNDDKSNEFSPNEAVSPPEWTRGLGIGFSNSLALQAVNLAKQRTSANSSSENASILYGSDSSEDA